MNQKKLCIILIIILIGIFMLWITGIIPKQIAKFSATSYLKNSFPKKNYEFVNIEWSSSFDGYLINFKDENDKIVSFIMNNKYFPIYPGQGTFALKENYRVEYEAISDINDFYNHSITSNYKDIRSLPESYSKEQAQNDNCFILGAMVHNDNLYSEFMNKYNKKENAFIRVVQSTIEGDIFIIDVLYEANNNKIHLVRDYSRDKFSSLEDRIVKYNTYEKTGVWKYQNSEYWVAYNGELPDGNIAAYSINSDELFIIATIN